MTKKKQTKKGLGETVEYVPKKKGTGKWVFLGVGVAAAGVVTYFTIQHFKKPRPAIIQSNTPPIQPDPKPTSSAPKTTTTSNTASTPKATDDFPLKMHSKGNNVKLLQQALMAQGGRDILKPYYDDGEIGTVTLAALTKLGYPTEVNQNAFNVIVNSGNSIDPVKVAEDLYTAITKKDYNSALAALQKIKSTKDYEKVATAFGNYKIDTVHKTIVTAVLQAFTDAKQKVAIGLALSAAGLKYDAGDDKWALSGIGDGYLITQQATRVWKDPQTSIDVPANMVLGTFVTTRGEYTVFQNEARYFLVPTQHIAGIKQKK